MIENLLGVHVCKALREVEGKGQTEEDMGR